MAQKDKSVKTLTGGIEMLFKHNKARHSTAQDIRSQHRTCHTGNTWGSVEQFRWSGSMRRSCKVNKTNTRKNEQDWQETEGVGGRGRRSWRKRPLFRIESLAVFCAVAIVDRRPLSSSLDDVTPLSALDVVEITIIFHCRHRRPPISSVQFPTLPPACLNQHFPCHSQSSSVYCSSSSFHAFLVPSPHSRASFSLLATIVRFCFVGCMTH